MVQVYLNSIDFPVLINDMHFQLELHKKKTSQVIDPKASVYFCGLDVVCISRLDNIRASGSTGKKGLWLFYLVTCLFLGGFYSRDIL